MGAYADHLNRGGFMSRRAFGFIATALFHVLLVYGLINGLARSVVEVLKGPIAAKVIEEVQDKQDEPPPPPPKFDKPPPPFVPPPDFVFNTTEPAPTAISNATSKAPVQAAEAAPTTPKTIKGRNYQPEYPPSSKRNGEEGTVVLEILVLEDGTVSDVKVSQSSGFPKLDEAAENEARRSFKFQPGTKGGKPVAVRFNIKIKFKIEK